MKKKRYTDEQIAYALGQEKLEHWTPGSLLACLGVTRVDVRKASGQIEV